MNPRDIALQLTRPMSEEDADRLILERYGAREFVDPDPQTMGELEFAAARVNREELKRRGI